ncbi:hypothetical protein BJ322DRAFT_1075460 [Thelephora terrestris]|uniref:Uncharacterized protein n=1 Tax=Thelephora terrestris TaxID=56493 RepID=A0A9P6L4U6_9AGAM|nr:hypothetical protein BJ322DRAFT_1075460 [Thelephora terrestris]
MFINARDIPLTPILPLSFERQLPRISDTPTVSIGFEENITIMFCGSCNSKLTRSIDLDAHAPYARSTFGGLPFHSVRKLRVSFRNSTGGVDTVFLFTLLRYLKGLECLTLKWNTVGPLGYWIGLVDQAAICPALSRLVVIDDNAEECVEMLKEVREVRERAGVPIANVEICNEY